MGAAPARRGYPRSGERGDVMRCPGQSLGHLDVHDALHRGVGDVKHEPRGPRLLVKLHPRLGRVPGEL